LLVRIDRLEEHQNPGTLIGRADARKEFDRPRATLSVALR
jgi:hypothetical protein